MNTTNNITFYDKILLFFIYLNSATILIPDKFKAWPIATLALIVIIRYFKQKTKPTLEIKKLLNEMKLRKEAQKNGVMYVPPKTRSKKNNGLIFFFCILTVFFF